MRFSTPLLATLISPSLSSPSKPPIRQIYTFPNNTFIENIAARSDSHLLITSLSVPTLFSIDPTTTTPTAQVIHTFPNATGLSGVTEIRRDVFALVTGVWDLASTRATPGSLAIWTADFTMTTTPNPQPTRHPSNPTVLLAADSAAGRVWRVNLLTGSYEVAFSDPLLTPVGTAPGTNLGINGLKARGEYLYFTNSARRFFGRVGIDLLGSAVGRVEVIANSSVAGGDVVYDDFALEEKHDGGAWIASHPSYVVHVDSRAGQTVVNDTGLLLNPTSAAFGRGDGGEERTLYVTNGGEFVGEDFTLVNEGVVAVDMRSACYRE
ncbi:hypothetical protein NKR19_g278 [Coniochaeta hoffmannii]|uniref:SMP-30/Gluconolactonase/LRE-like region domain-containing protein n=1 Tax=Coniochaeta hoffmannii TaxID=91930 RepID=A0AA38S9H8_9PEZI|nr:hypothetical protein NKR19_g278 [Coniochaeta hoffmannii]